MKGVVFSQHGVCVNVQGKHPGHPGQSDIMRLGGEDKLAVLLSHIPDVDELLETLQFQRQCPDLLKEVRCRHHPLLLCTAW